MENQILEDISHIKNVSKKSPTAENFLNHISKTSASNTDFSLVNENIRQLIAKNKINDHFKIVKEPENGNLNQSTDEAQTLLNDELNEILDGRPTTHQLVNGKELEILIMPTIATLNRKKQKMCTGESF